MKIQLIALDMDGTTLQDDHVSISPRTEKAIRTAMQQGILVVPATGRPNSLLPDFVMQMENIRYTITSNGAVTYDRYGRKTLHTSFIEPKLAYDILMKLPLDEILVEIFKDEKLFAQRKNLESILEYPVPFLHLKFLKKIHAPVDSLPEYVLQHGEHIEKINVPYVPEKWQKELLERFSGMSTVSLTSSVPDNLEINARRANKGEALRNLCEMLRIPSENVLAMGDNGNDIEMLKFAGLSVVPENGTPEAKEAAKAVTASNRNDGIAMAIEKYALQAC